LPTFTPIPAFFKGVFVRRRISASYAELIGRLFPDLLMFANRSYTDLPNAAASLGFMVMRSSIRALRAAMVGTAYLLHLGSAIMKSDAQPF
jgi:hypothetical protein